MNIHDDGSKISEFNNCDDPTRARGPAAKSLVVWAGQEDLWLEAYHLAWKLATENGWDSLSYMAGADGDDGANVERFFDCGEVRLGPCRDDYRCQIFFGDEREPKQRLLTRPIKLAQVFNASEVDKKGKMSCVAVGE